MNRSSYHRPLLRRNFPLFPFFLPDFVVPSSAAQRTRNQWRSWISELLLSLSESHDLFFCFTFETFLCQQGQQFGEQRRKRERERKVWSLKKDGRRRRGTPLSRLCLCVCMCTFIIPFTSVLNCCVRARLGLARSSLRCSFYFISFFFPLLFLFFFF